MREHIGTACNDSAGKRDGYHEAATVFWDYYLYDDALRVIAEAVRG